MNCVASRGVLLLTLLVCCGSPQNSSGVKDDANLLDGPEITGVCPVPTSWHTLGLELASDVTQLILKIESDSTPACVTLTSLVVGGIDVEAKFDVSQTSIIGDFSADPIHVGCCASDLDCPTKVCVHVDPGESVSIGPTGVSLDILFKTYLSDGTVVFHVGVWPIIIAK